MAPIPKIVSLQLEQRTIRYRNNGMSYREIADKLSHDTGEQISHKAVERYLHSVDEAAVAIVHQPRHAEAQAELTIDIAQGLRDMLAKLGEMLPKAEAETEDGGPNWYGLSVVLRETREYLKSYTDVTDRIYGAEQVAAFQRATTRTLESLSPSLLREFERRLAEEVEIARRSSLGSR